VAGIGAGHQMNCAVTVGCRFMSQSMKHAALVAMRLSTSGW